jgi:murein DD-endopeptidase MepM/ murein hydrolase activator NlpD
MGLFYSETFDDYRYHDGIDIKGIDKDEVIASLSGRVVNLTSTKGDKHTIIINHGNDWQSEYSHLEDVKIKKGDTVKAGQIIGVIGQPGLNEVKIGPHLHYRLLRNEQSINPLKYLP